MQAVLSSWGGSTKLQFKILFPCILFALCALLASTFQFLKVLAFFGQIFESAGILWANFCTSSHLKGFVKRQRFDKMLSVYFFSSIFVVERPVAASIYCTGMLLQWWVNLKSLCSLHILGLQGPILLLYFFYTVNCTTFTLFLLFLFISHRLYIQNSVNKACFKLKHCN